MNNSMDNLYKKGSSETSPKALDDLILNAAKQSCEPNIQSKSRTWMMPLATAAVFVMGLSMIINLRDTQSELKIPDFNGTDGAIEIEFLPEEQVEAYSKQGNKKARTINAKPKKTALKKQLSTPKFNTEPQAVDRITAEEIQLEIAPIQAPSIISVEKPETVSNFVRREKQATTPAKKALKEKKKNQTFGYSRNKNEEKEEGLIGNITSHIVIDNGLIEQDPIATSSVKTNQDDSIISTDLHKLDKLIQQEKFEQAKELLIQLQKKYPRYNFSVYEKILKIN